MIRWLWKSGKPRETEGDLSSRVEKLEGQLREVLAGEAARELAVANALTQMQRLAGRISKQTALDAQPQSLPLASVDDVYRAAREKGIVR